MKIEDYFVEGELSDLKDNYHKRFIYELLIGNFNVSTEENGDCIHYTLNIKTRYSTESFKYYFSKNFNTLNIVYGNYNLFLNKNKEDKELLEAIHNKTLEIIENNKIDNLEYEIKTQLRLAEENLKNRINKINKLKEELNKLIK